MNEEKQLIVDYWDRVKAACKEKKLTQAALCEKAGIGFPTLKSQIAHTVAPSVFDSQKIASVLGVTVEYLTTGKDSGTVSKDKFEVFFDGLKELVGKVDSVQ